MAEALLKMSAKRGVKVWSAGIKPGSEVNDQAMKAMREVGYDLSGHKPKHISAFSNIKFDYVAKMDVPDLGDSKVDRGLADTRSCSRSCRGIPENPGDDCQQNRGRASAVTEATKVGDGRRAGRHDVRVKIR